jgi:hypothetical protein
MRAVINVPSRTTSWSLVAPAGIDNVISKSSVQVLNQNGNAFSLDLHEAILSVAVSIGLL